MIALSIKKNSLNFLSVYKSTNQLNSESYGVLNFKEQKFNENLIAKVKQTKKIKKSKYPSKKCMIFLESSEVILNKFNCPDEINPNQFLDWSNHLTFNEGVLDAYSDYHYELSSNSFLSLYIKKEKQSKYYNACSNADLELKVLSLGILSANHLAKESFEAKSEKSYMVWGIGKNSDEILVSENGQFSCLLNIKRSSSNISLINFIGSRKIVKNIVDTLNKKIYKDLKSFDVVDKIYMYQKSPNLGMKKIYNKKNKDSIVILNPLLKMGNIKKNKINVIESSYLAEMGYILKSVENNGS